MSHLMRLIGSSHGSNQCHQPSAVYSPLGSNQCNTLIKSSNQNLHHHHNIAYNSSLEDFTNLISSLVIKRAGESLHGIESKEKSHEGFPWHFFWP